MLASPAPDDEEHHPGSSDKGDASDEDKDESNNGANDEPTGIGRRR